MPAEQPNVSSRLGADDETVVRSGTERSERRRRSRRSGGRFREFIEDVPGWWLAVLLVAAPWAYGTTFPETKEWLAKGLCVLGGAFIFSLLLRGRALRVSWLSLGLSFLILGYGWFITWNAKLTYDPHLFYFHPGSPHLPSWPGSVDQRTSADQMLLITGLFCAFWVVSDLCTRERWRQRFWLVLSLAGVSIVVLGLVQRLSGAPGIFWRTDLECGNTFFATYRYHANAGAFINLILPFVAAQCASAFRRDASGFGKVFWTLSVLAVITSACVNLSRAATLISAGIMAIFLVWQFFEITRRRGHGFNAMQTVVVLAIVIVGSWLMVREVGFSKAYQHWQELGGVLADNFRYAAYDTIEHRVLPQSGWFGFGPNTFSLIFPFFTNALGYRIWGYWEQAHQDYLQTLVEWGYGGAVLWFFLFGNSIARAIHSLWRRRRMWDGRTRALAIAALLALVSVLLHSTVDFPMQIASLQLYVSVILGMVAALPYIDSTRHRRFSTLPGTDSIEEPATVNGTHLVFEGRKGVM